MFSTVMPNFQSAALPLAGNRALLKNVGLAVVGSLALAASAKVQVGFPIPWSLQSLVVLMIGMAYGWKLGGATVLLYLAEGALGLPVFAKGGGFAYFISQPSAGYLLGFLIAAVATGFLAERGFDRNPLTTAIAMLVGSVLIYIPGLLVLSIYFPGKALAYGFLPFWTADLLKLAIAAALMPTAWLLLNKFRKD